eukprot:1048241-Prymnesium_polylepis.3
MATVSRFSLQLERVVQARHLESKLVRPPSLAARGFGLRNPGRPPGGGHLRKRNRSAGLALPPEMWRGRNRDPCPAPTAVPTVTHSHTSPSRTGRSHTHRSRPDRRPRGRATRDTTTYLAPSATPGRGGARSVSCRSTPMACPETRPKPTAAHS